MNIAFYKNEEHAAPFLQAMLAGHSLHFFPNALCTNNVPPSGTEVICITKSSKIDASILQVCPDIKCICTQGTGHDHIDLSACSKKGIIVCNVPTYGENTVAEYTFALMLSLSRKMYQGIQRVREEVRFDSRDLGGFDLKGKTLGVVGTGHIGLAVIKIARGFEMNVIAYNRTEYTHLPKEYGFQYVQLDELFKTSDIITLHVPYTSETHYLVNKNNILDFKKGSILINTSRGGVVETESIAVGLQREILAGAALDVLEEEGYIGDEISFLYNTEHPNSNKLKILLADHVLMHMPNVIVTPHNAFHTKEAMQRIFNTTVANIHGYLNNQPINVLTNG